MIGKLQEDDHYWNETGTHLIAGTSSWNEANECLPVFIIAGRFFSQKENLCQIRGCGSVPPCCARPRGEGWWCQKRPLPALCLLLAWLMALPWTGCGFSTIASQVFKCPSVYWRPTGPLCQPRHHGAVWSRSDGHLSPPVLSQLLALPGSLGCSVGAGSTEKWRAESWERSPGEEKAPGTP